MQRVVTFMEQRHYLALARQHDEKELARKITDANHFYVRLTNMVRAIDPTSEILLSHYARHFTAGSTGALADLILNIMFLRNTMSKEVIKMCGQGKMPWLTAEAGCVSEDSKRAVDEVFLALGGKVFFQHVEPMSLFYRRIFNRVERVGDSTSPIPMASFACVVCLGFAVRMPESSSIPLFRRVKTKQQKQ